MGKVIYDISMSLDGYITAANVRAEAGWGGLGEGGARLHDWGFNSADERNREIGEALLATTGAVIVGRTTYNVSIPNWGADGPTGAARLPVVVVSHRVPQDMPNGGVYTFVDSVDAALEQRKKRQAKRISSSRAGTLRSNSSHAAWWTSSLSTSSLCCSAAARHWSDTWTASTSR